ncbi:unnamed protein product [Mytilus edulis]|uniref:C-type lectin domain-containing protein n=1 Tax=Mytilus edulis TaxID=6550 RepID=A0A8S3VNY2_MYTED|nr:unnamed protein product [Mytilus edulis]
MNQCRDNGGYLAPIIDNQNYQFIMDDVLSTVLLTKSTQVWLGTHSITGSPSNWNNDPSFVTSLLPSSSGEKCVVIDSNQIQSWEPCNTNSGALTGAVCLNHGLGLKIIVKYIPSAGDIPLISPEPITCEPEISNVTINPTTITELERTLSIDPEQTTAGDIPLISPEPITCKPEISNVKINPTTITELKRTLSIDPEQTNAYKLTKISVYEDRPTAKAIGYVGVVVLISVIVLIVLLDCQHCISKKKTS